MSIQRSNWCSRYASFQKLAWPRVAVTIKWSASLTRFQCTLGFRVVGVDNRVRSLNKKSYCRVSPRSCAGRQGVRITGPTGWWQTKAHVVWSSWAGHCYCTGVYRLWANTDFSALKLQARDTSFPTPFSHDQLQTQKERVKDSMAVTYNKPVTFN